MLKEWNKGLNLSIQPEGMPEHFDIPEVTGQKGEDVDFESGTK